MSTTFTFPDSSSSEAYDESQWRTDIKFGAILVVPRERVVGFLCGAWPCAVTKDAGSFHRKVPGRTWPDIGTHDSIDYGKVAEQAIEVAKNLGFEIDY
jgi:hypothetical protein